MLYLVALPVVLLRQVSGLKMESFPSKIRLGDTRGSVYRYNQPEIEAEAGVWFFVMPTQPPQIKSTFTSVV